jgi:type I restriction enzyme S subunit
MSATRNERGVTNLRRFKPYLAYKDSGVEWLDTIPAQWKLQRLKTMASLQLSNVDKKSVEGETPVRLCNYVHVYYHERITPDLDFMAATATDEQVRRFGLRAGDVLITKDSETPDDIAVPSVVAEDLPGVICGYHLAHIRPDPDVVDGRFLARAFSAVGPRDQFHVAANGITRYGLTGDAIGSSVLPVPPLVEQHSIAAFLDRETAEIDALVAKKERVIELLQEKRTALVTRAVTKGLDPTVPMKDSGVEWLGEIPAHWGLRALKRLGGMQAGTAITSQDIEPDGEYPVFGGNGIRGYADSYTQDGDFPLVGRQGALCGCVNFASGKFWASEHAVVVTPAACVDAHWLADLLAAMSLNRYSQSAAQPGLAIDTIGAIPAPAPSLDEQRAIAAFLDHETARIDSLVAKVRDAIERLKELRTALISAAVTGKIDVRGDVAV